MTDHYKISLITPVYNAMEYIQQAFESVKEQTLGFENIEWLLVDDRSTDGTFALLSECAKTYPNIKLLQTEENSGTPALPRNIGLDHATAPYVMFLDNDDAFFPNACRALYEEIEKSGADIVTGDVELLNAKSLTKREQKAAVSRTESFAYGHRLMEMPLGEWIIPYILNHWCKIYKREIIEAHHIRCLPGELSEDIVFLYLYMSCVRDMVHIDEPILRYRVRQESLSHIHTKRFLCSLPKTLHYGMECAEAMGPAFAAKYAAMLRWGDPVEFYINAMLDSETLSREDAEACLLAWKPIFLIYENYVLPLHSAYCKILSDDFSDGQDKKAFFHFHTLRELYKQRQTEKNDILGSTTYRVAKVFSDLKGRVTRRKA